MTPISTRRMFNFAAIAVAGACLASIPSYASEQDRPHDDKQDHKDRIAQPSGERANMPQGIKWSDDPADLDDVRGVISSVAGAAVINDGFNDVVERFVDQDRNRFGEWMGRGENKEFADFNAAAAKFQAAYKQKFHKDFDFNDDAAIAGLTAVQGEIEDPALVAANWPVAAMPGMEGRMGGAEPRIAAGAEPSEDVKEQGNIEKGRNVAIATLPAPHMAAHAGARVGAEIGEKPAADRQPEQPGAAAGVRAGASEGMAGKGLRISLVNELPGAWKVDVPASRTPEQVYSDLSKRIDKLAQDTAAWPSEESQVQHLIAYEVFSAIYGVDMHKAGEKMNGAKPGDSAERPHHGDDMGPGGGQ